MIILIVRSTLVILLCGHPPPVNQVCGEFQSFLMSACTMFGCFEGGTLEHQLISFSKHRGIGQRLLECLELRVPDLQPGGALRLEHSEISSEWSLRMTLIMTAIIFQSLCKEREVKTAVRTYRVGAYL